MTEIQEPVPPSSTAMNDWFLTLPPERQAILREDKWMLAEAAFAAGREDAMANAKPLVGWRYVARREDDDTMWAGQFFDNSGCAFGHEKSLKGAMHAKSRELLQEAMFKQFCGYPHDPMGQQANGRYSIWKVANGRVFEVIVDGYVPGQAYFQNRAFNDNSIDGDNNWYWDFARLAKHERDSLTKHRFACFKNPDDFERVWKTVCRLARMLSLQLTEEAGSTQPVSAEDLEVAAKNFVQMTDGGLQEADLIKIDASFALLRFSQMFRQRAAEVGAKLTLQGYDPTAPSLLKVEKAA
jgi:hypothetical protein